VTISTNYKVKNGDMSDYEDKAEEFVDALTWLTDSKHPERMLSVVEERTKDRELVKGDNVLTYTSDTVIENGSDARGSRIHSHSLIQIEHTTFLKIDPDKVKRLIYDKISHWIPPRKKSKEEPWKAIYVHIRMVPEDSKRILKYISKGFPDGGEIKDLAAKFSTMGV